MQNKNIFRLLSLILFVTFAFSILTTSAMGGSKTAAGVIRGSDGAILFTVDENFFAARNALGVYLIEIDERLECRFRPDGQQAALGPRLATPVFSNRYITSNLFFVASDAAGVCNVSAIYQFQEWNRATDDPADGGFSFQIIGIRPSEDDDDDDD